MKSKIFNVLIVGAGNIGAFYDSPKSSSVLTHAHAFIQHNGFHLLGFVDIDIKKAKKAAKLWNAKAFSNVDEAFASHEIDVVCNATPDELHFTILKKLLSKKVKLIFTEKPLTSTIPETKEIIKISHKNKVPIVVNYRRRFVPEFIKLAQEIKTGMYGEFLAGTGYYGKGVMHNGSHLIDLLRFLVGEIESSKVTGKIHDYKINDPSLSAILTLSNKKNFFLECIDSRLYTIFEIDLLFSKNRLRIIDSGNIIEKQTIKIDTKYKDHKNMSDGKVSPTSLAMSMYFAADNIYHHLAGTGELINPLKEGSKTMETTDKIRHS